LQTCFDTALCAQCCERHLAPVKFLLMVFLPKKRIAAATSEGEQLRLKIIYIWTTEIYFETFF
jgi:hypothetical protein